MELRQLEHFVAVAEEQHFTRAARRVHIVQSGLSSSIRALEQEFGVALFVRSTRRVRLTAAGQALYQKATQVMAAAREAREAVAAVQGLERGKLTLGTVQSLGAFIDLPELVDRFHALHPGIEIQLCQGSTTHLMDKIRDGRLDLAFMPLIKPPQGVATRLVACEAMVATCAVDHAMADRAQTSLAGLKDEPFVDFQDDWGTRQIVDRAFVQAGVNRYTAFEVSDLNTLLDLVSRGLGIALVPEAIAEARTAVAHPCPVSVLQLEAPEICWELVAAFAGDRSAPEPEAAAARAFLNLLTLRDAPEAGAFV